MLKEDANLIRDDDTPQHKAVREAMTNAIIHADLMVDGVLKVEKYDNKLVFTNPGLLKLPVEQIYAGEETKARNQRIQNMFRMIGYGKNLGSGFPLILSAWNEKHWLKPELMEQPELHQVKLVLAIEGESDKSIASKINVPDDCVELTERQKAILEMIAIEPFLSAKSISKKVSEKISEKVNVTSRTIENDLTQLKKKGIIKREGGRKNGRWVLTPKEQTNNY